MNYDTFCIILKNATHLQKIVNKYNKLAKKAKETSTNWNAKLAKQLSKDLEAFGLATSEAKNIANEIIFHALAELEYLDVKGLQAYSTTMPGEPPYAYSHVNDVAPTWTQEEPKPKVISIPALRKAKGPKGEDPSVSQKKVSQKKPHK